MPVIPAVGTLRPEVHEFEASLGYNAMSGQPGPCTKTLSQKQTKQTCKKVDNTLILKNKEKHKGQFRTSKGNMDGCLSPVCLTITKQQCFGCFIKKEVGVAHVCNSSTQDTEVGGLPEVEATLAYVVSFGSARAIGPVSKGR